MGRGPACPAHAEDSLPTKESGPPLSARQAPQAVGGRVVGGRVGEGKEDAVHGVEEEGEEGGERRRQQRHPPRVRRGPARLRAAQRDVGHLRVCVCVRARARVLASACVCVRACVRACAAGCVCARAVLMPVRACVRARARVCARARERLRIREFSE